MFAFLKGLDDDLVRDLMRKLRDQWVYGSSGLRGNALTREELDLVIGIGMTVHGKPLEDHQEAVDHASAVDLLFNKVRRKAVFDETDLLELHETLKNGEQGNCDEPVGAWKRAPNGTYVSDGGSEVYYEFAAPSDVPCLMKKWLILLNSAVRSVRKRDEALAAYARLHMAMVWIHPFCDGNGRMARLVANIPVLTAGFPPILISREDREEYIRILSAYKLREGTPTRQTALLPANPPLKRLFRFFERSWRTSLDMTEKAHQVQAWRNLVKERPEFETGNHRTEIPA